MIQRCLHGASLYHAAAPAPEPSAILHGDSSVIRLIAIDLDGTLLDSQGQVPARNQQALAEVQKLGIEVVLVTGRRFEFARQATADVPGDPVLIVSNGAVIRRRQGDPLFRQTLPAAVARRVLAAAQPFRQYAALVFDRDSGGQVVFEHLDWSDPSRRNYLERNRPFLRVCTPLEAALTEDPIQVMFAGPLDKLGTLRTLLESSGGRDFTLAVTEYPARNFAILDVLAPGCSKGAALRLWTTMRGLEPHEVMAIGDNFNDREMLEFAGLAVVMQNAPEELKATGWAVTLSNDQAGVAAALDRFVLQAARPSATVSPPERLADGD